ncbi:MAG: hypothetical protein JWN69_1498, partial [Alphaproteobacteria bacterium]|nr:hypothetical protein [Alphaproteobacteria bacterium]
HPAMTAADRDRFARERLIIARFDRRVEGINVHMDDLAERALVTLHRGCDLIKARAHEHP